MIDNSLLDSKLSVIINTAKERVQILTNEILAVEKENSQLQDLVSVTFQDQGNLMLEANALDSQLKIIKEINENLKFERDVVNEKVSKAQDDFVNVSKAYQLQQNKIHMEIESLKD